MMMKLPANQARRIPVHIYNTISSTNEKLWEIVARGEIPAAAIARSQTAGRGQWGRQWQSPPGGLYLSVALNTHIRAADAAHLTFLSTWGVANALRHHHVPVLLKWPNDLILQGRKLGGIKSETRLDSGQITQAVIGIGLNWANPVPAAGINLHRFPGHLITSLEALAAIAVWGVFQGYSRYLSSGIDTILVEYLKLFASQGRRIAINGSSGVVTGVTAQGKLCVRLQSSGAAAEIELSPGAVSLGYEI